MIKNILTSVFILLLISTNLLSNSVKILIEGNKRIDPETIKIYGEISDKENYTDQDINNILKNLYSTDFFEDINISFENKILRINVKEYPIIGKLKFEGEPAKKIVKNIKERIFSSVNGPFIKNRISDDLNAIQNGYKYLGYHNAKVEPKIENLEDNKINLLFVIDRGEKLKISKINFIGDKKIKERRLRDIIVSEENKFYKVLSQNTNFNESNIDLDKRLLVNFYKSLGFYNIKILSSSAIISSESAEITYNIDAGERHVITKISTNVAEQIEKKFFFDLQKYYSDLIGDYYSPFKIKKVLDQLDILIVKNDLQFIEHSVNELVDDGKIEVVINISEGKKILVERVNISGNTITDESVIRGELLLDEGDPFNFLKLEKSVSRIKSRNLFGKVEKEVKDGSSIDEKIIDILVEEKPTGEIAAGAGVGTDGGTFSLSVKENNYLGSGVSVAGFTEVNEHSFKGELSINNPNYNDTGNGLRYSIASITNDEPDSGYENSILSSSVGLKVEQFERIFFTPSLSITSDKLDVQSTASEKLKKQAGTFNELLFGYGYIYDERDKPYLPTDGFITSFSQVLPMYAEAPFLKNTLKFTKYETLTEDFIGSVKLFFSAINPIAEEDVRLSKRLSLPRDRLRGFQRGKIGPKDGNDFIGGNYAATMNLEARLPNFLPESTNTNVGLFMDFGNLWGVDYDSSISGSNKIRSSAGAIVNWLSPLGPMNFTFSTNISKETTDKTESFNFSLGTTF